MVNPNQYLTSIWIGIYLLIIGFYSLNISTCTGRPNLEVALMMVNTKEFWLILNSCFISFTRNFVNVKMVCSYVLCIFYLILVGIPS